MGFNIIEELHPVRDAISLLSKALGKLDLQPFHVIIDQAVGMIAAETIKAPMDWPPHDRSVLDGFAARWKDIASASEESPAVLELKGSIPIDSPTKPVLNVGEAYEVATGSPMPQGADVVVPIEYADVKDGKVLVYRSFPGGYGVSARGEDLREGDIIVEKGSIINEWNIGALAGAGISKILVWPKLNAVIASTGDELIEPWEKYKPGKVYSSTARIAMSYLKARYVDVEYKGVLGDSEDIIEDFIVKSVEKYDVVFTTGGTSVGKRDATIRVLYKLADDIIHGFALTPGRPGAIAIVNGKPVIALSGMPVAALSELIAVWDPAYRGLLGRGPWEPVIPAVASKSFTSHAGMMNVVRARACIGDNGTVTVSPLRVTGSGILSTLLKANGFFIVPEDVTGIPEEETIEFHLTGSLGVC